MNFHELSLYLQKLEGTSSRNSIIEILAELYKETNKAEIGQVTYLLQGRVVPIYTDLEFGMADKMVIKAIAKAYDEPEEDVRREYKKLGDLGILAEKKTAEHHGKDSISIDYVFETLKKIAESRGEGSVEVKIDLLANLFKSADPLSARYIARIPVGNLRLGFSDMTVLDALSWSLTGTKEHRKELETAYNVRPDLGLIAEAVKEHGIKGVAHIKPAVFNPILMARAERLSSGAEIIEKIGKCALEPKFDGIRCISGYTPLYVKDRGLVSARDVHIGDKVLTHKGRFKKIIASKTRTIDKHERLFKLQSFLGNEIKITEGHPLLVLRSGKQEWISVENIQKEDFLIFPKPQLKSLAKTPNPHFTLTNSSGYSKTISASYDFYRLLGFWIGDGFTNEFHNTQRIGLTFNEKTEKTLAEEYKQIIRTVLQIEQISEYSHNGGLNIYWRDEPFKDWLCTYFRREWKGKIVPEWFINLSKERFEAFLKGWIESDGTPRHGGGFKITTKESDLAAFVQLIGLSHNIPIGLRRIRILNKTYFELIIPGKSTRKIFIEKDFLKVKILHFEEIKNRDPRTSVYNFQVEVDESYCTPLITFHNCQIHKKDSSVKIYSRGLEDTTVMFPDVVEGVRKQILAKEAIIEGEALAYNPKTDAFLPFQITTQRKRKYGIEEMAEKYPLRLMTFELLYLDGKPTLYEPYEERRKKLSKIIKKGSTIVLSPDTKTDDPKILEAMFDEYLTQGLEGIMAKRLDGAYQAGARGWNWIKLKRSYSASALNDTIDALVMGYYAGRGKRTDFGIGGFLIGVYDKKQDKFVTVSKVGTGLTDDEWRELKKRSDKIRAREKPPLYEVDKALVPDVWVEPEIIVEIRADELTRSPNHTAGRVMKISKSGSAQDVETPGYALRFPRLEKFRDDKKIEDATSVKEIEEMFEKQGKK